MIDTLITLDIETYYSKEYSLSRKGTTTESYVRDPRFEFIGIGVKVAGRPAVWMETHEFRAWAATVPWERVAMLAHNAAFDGFALSHHCGIVPGLILDTLSIARALHGIDVGKSLANLGLVYGVGVKGREVADAIGKRRADFTAEEFAAYGSYCRNDVEMTERLFWCVAPQIPELEQFVIDLTLRCFVDPCIELDRDLTEAALKAEVDKKAALMSRISADRDALMSNEKFAALLLEMGVDPPMKVSAKRTATARAKDPEADEVWTPAFSKADDGFKALLEHERDEIRWLAEARVGVKSTIRATRAQRFLDIASRGPMPVFLRYCGAHTRRWSAGDSSNFQNLPRGGPLRKALSAPEGYVFVVADSGQIEARVNAWIWDYHELLDIFRRNDETEDGDFYSDAGSQYFGKPLSKKDTPDERQTAKAMCLSAGTRVLTERGWIPIVDVTMSDRVWDGVEWVSHEGLICQGEKEVWEMNSVSATPDHGILTADGWREWQEVLTNRSLFQSALGSATLPSSSGLGASIGGDTIRKYGATVAGLATYPDQTLKAVPPLGATVAQKRQPQIRATPKSKAPYQTMWRENGSSTGSVPVLGDVRIRKTGLSNTTEVEVSASIPHGSRTKPLSLHTLPNSLDGTTQTCNWIGSTITADMNRGTYASPPSAKTCGTDAVSQTCSDGSKISKRRTLTYDLVSAGPRHRFTILTSAGPLIAHNCLGLGFQMGWKRFASELLKGMLGAPPVRFTREDVAKYGVDLEGFASEPRNIKAVRAIPSRLPPDALLVHCAVAAYFVDVYRELNPKIVSGWETCSGAIEKMHAGETFSFGAGGQFTVEKDRLVLPAGGVLRYPDLRQKTDKRRTQWSYRGGHGKGAKAFTKIYGGLLTENIVQATARDIIAEQAVKVREAGLRIVTLTHDEIVACVPEDEGEKAYEKMVEIMTTPPEWCSGLPLSAEGGFSRSYGDCK